MARLTQTPTGDFIKQVLGFYEQGLTIDALQRAETFAPLKDWAGISPCVIAARLAANAGAPRLNTRLSVRAWRMDKTHPASQLQFGFQLSEHRGPLAAWRAMRTWKTAPETMAEDQAELLAAQARVVSDLRDFTTAEKLLDRAENLCASKPWIRLQRAHLLEAQDRVEEALEVALAATALHTFPFYRPGVQTTAHLLQLLDRDDDAIALLQEAGTTIQNGPVAVQLYGILSENGLWSEAEIALSRYVELSPLLEPHLRKWVSAQRSRVAYHLGKRTEAIRLAGEFDDPFHKHFVKKLEAAPDDGDRVRLDVSFVRQHFKTCAPATLAALGRYWRLPAEHLKLAEAMCYDGTPHWQQRDWAEKNGWFVREFRVTQESVFSLITRGIPFAVSTVAATSAHLQAVVGFDRVRGTILLRDPGQPYTVEVFAETFFQRQRSFGPHGTVYLPVAEQSKMDGLALPDTAIYDDFHRFSLSLRKHDRETAAKNLEAMASAYEDHALVWEARLDLAGYDANVSEQLRCLDRLLELFPGNAARQLRRLGCLRTASRHERIGYLEAACRVPEAHPALFVELARLLGDDARSAPEAARHLRRALRFAPQDSNAITVQANLLWEQAGFEEATELYRFAANLEGYREHLYQSWFTACRRTRRTDEAISLLEDRFRRFGTRSEQPGTTLAWAWRELNQPQRAREVYAEAARLKPDNGYLLLNAATLEARLRNSVETEKFLEAARDKVRRTDWLRTSAEIAEMRLDTAASLRISREIIEAEPLALDAHGGIARALAQLEGNAAAYAHLKAACLRFPHHYGLQRLLVDWSHDATDVEAETAARELLRIDLSDAWARRELSTILLKAGRLDDALHEATEAAQIEPRNSYSFSVLGHICNRRQQPAEARSHFHHAVELSVDNSDALHALIALAQTDKERKEQLAFVEEQLVQQVVTGEGLLAFRELASPILDPEKLLQSLQIAYQERSDLWHVRSALAAQLGHLKRLDEALDIAKQATERFPHMPRIWLDLAKVHQWRKELDLEIDAARRAFEINPGWSRATLRLTDALERRGKFEDAGKIFERALPHVPNDAQVHAGYAHLLWRQRQPARAFAELERALRIAPGYEWAWDLFREWATERGEPRRAADFVRTLTQERPGERRVWLMLARTLQGPDAMAERLDAIDKALALEQRSTEAWDLKAELLANGEQFDDALQAVTDGLQVCLSELHILRGRRAWVEARRRRLPEAVRLMREVLAENSGYVWGWNQLSHWLVEQGSLVDAAAALETLQRLRPHDSWVSRQLGFLKLKQDDRAGAQKSFAAAFQIAPTDVQAAHNLFELQLKSSDLTGAAETLRLMELHQPGAATDAVEITLLLRLNEKKVAAKILEKLCASADPDDWPLNAASDAFRRAGQSGLALKIYKRSLKSGSCNPQTATAAIRLLLARRQHWSAVWLFLQLQPGEPQRRAAAPVVQGLAEAKEALAFRWLLWRRRSVLAAEDASWGQVGYALSTFQRSKASALWLSDWRNRRDVQPWMLFNLCLGLRQLGRYPESTEVVRYAVQKWGHREGSADLRLFLAVEDALAGDVAGTQENLKQVSIREKVAYDQDLLAIAKALVEFQQSPAQERVKQFKAARAQLEKRFTARRVAALQGDVRRTFSRAGAVFIQNGGGWRARLWFNWVLYSRWVLLGLFALVFPPALI
ncbi:MAG TPA: C39 family peptidase, partial [Verrucomicrobiae bacterium]|nr:C39 family peptidase [Verrucomicrobiae bacterium]